MFNNTVFSSDISYRRWATKFSTRSNLVETDIMKDKDQLGLFLAIKIFVEA